MLRFSTRHFLSCSLIISKDSILCIMDASAARGTWSREGVEKGTAWRSAVLHSVSDMNPSRSESIKLKSICSSQGCIVCSRSCMDCRRSSIETLPSPSLSKALKPDVTVNSLYDSAAARKSSVFHILLRSRTPGGLDSHTPLYALLVQEVELTRLNGSRMRAPLSCK